MEREPCYRSFCLPSPQRSCIVCSPEDGGVRGTGGGVLGPCSDSVHAELQPPPFPRSRRITLHSPVPLVQIENDRQSNRENSLAIWYHFGAQIGGMRRVCNERNDTILYHTHTHIHKYKVKKKREQPDGTADRNRRARTGRTSCRRQVAALVASDGSWGAVEGCFRSGFRIDDRDL